MSLGDGFGPPRANADQPAEPCDAWEHEWWRKEGGNWRECSKCGDIEVAGVRAIESPFYVKTPSIA